MRFVLIVLLFFQFVVHADIKRVPAGKIHDIEDLFLFLIENHGFAYTIFGSKPMSLADLSLKTRFRLPLHKYLLRKYKIFKRKQQLGSWYQYKKEFGFKYFIFLDKEEDLFKDLTLVLINKQQLLAVLHTYEKAFKQELGDSFTPDGFLNRLENREGSLSQAIHRSQKLLGILLGYGERNATLFQERASLIKALAKDKKNGTQNEGLIQKLHAIEAQLGPFSDFEENSLIQLLHFLADSSHSETIALKTRYNDDRQLIDQLMEQPNFMERVLERLAE